MAGNIKFPRLLAINCYSYPYDDLVFYLACVSKFPISSDRIILLSKEDFIRSKGLSIDFVLKLHNHIYLDDGRYISVFDSIDCLTFPSGKNVVRVQLSNEFCNIINNIVSSGYGKLNIYVLQVLYSSRRRSCFILYILVSWIFGNVSSRLSIDDLRSIYRYKSNAEVMRHFKADLDDLNFLFRAKDIDEIGYSVVKDGKIIIAVDVYRNSFIV